MPATLEIQIVIHTWMPVCREELHLGPGDTLEIESEGDEITLRPVRFKALLKKEHGIWVYQGEPSDASIVDLIDRNRESYIRAVPMKEFFDTSVLVAAFWGGHRDHPALNSWVRRARSNRPAPCTHWPRSTLR
jgi:bifunctional DNA-binding transcriptional regulator/antitoxin component of YhaV-PrlF toxin-antitoxin module